MSAIGELLGALDELTVEVSAAKNKASETLDKLEPLVEALDELADEDLPLYPDMKKLIVDISTKLKDDIIEGSLTDILTIISEYHNQLTGER
jgi:hypothetical protein